VRTLCGDAPVHWQGPKEGQEHDEQGGYGREHSGCERRDARDVTERREVVHAGETDHLPPGVLLGSSLFRLRAWYVLDAVLEEPTLESFAWAL
jgi:hypothetical protein